MRLNNFSTSLDFNLSDLLKGKGGKKKPVAPQSGAGQSGQALQ